MPRPKRVTAQSLKVRKDKADEAFRRKWFASFCALNGIPNPVEDFRFAKPDRQWQIDLSWPDHRVGIEVQGGVWVTGAHSRGAQQIKDFEKLNAAQLRGWVILQFTPAQLCTAETMSIIRLALGAASRKGSA